MNTQTQSPLNLPRIPYHILVNLENFGFVEREKGPDGKPLLNRCGRDFLYYALHRFEPEDFSPTTINPVEIEREHLFGIPMPAPLVWTGLPFMHVPALMETYDLSLEINGLTISSHWNFMRAMFSKSLLYSQALNRITTCVDRDYVVGIDLPIGIGGLLDHLMFIYGFDAKNFYIFDTRRIPGLEYQKLTPADDKRFIMKLPFTIMQKHWTRFGRIWVVKKNISPC